MPIINLIYNAPRSWKPWANTLAYFPFSENQLDTLWNYTAPLTWTKQTLWYRFSTNSDVNIAIDISQRFVSCWVYFNWYNASGAQILSANDGWPFYNYYNSYANANKRYQAWGWWWQSLNSDQVNTNQWVRYHFAHWWDGTKIVCYLNWQKVVEQNAALNTGASCKFLTNIDVTLSNLIYEKVLWTQEEVVQYYNSTKENYWL